MNTEMNNHTMERYRRSVTRVSGRALADLRGISGQYPELDYFWGILEDTFVKLEQTGEEYIGTYCTMVPDELIYAFGYRPLRLCAGHSTAASFGEQFVPRDVCPLVKACTGFHAMRILPVYEQCRLAVLPMTCDAKKESASVLARYLPVIRMEVHAGKTGEQFEQMVEDLTGLVKSISMYTGKKLSNRLLVKVCRSVREAQNEAYRLYDLLAKENSAVSGAQVIAVMNSFCYDRPETWAEHVRMLNDKLEKVSITENGKGRAKPRIFLAGAPVIFPNLKLPLLLESLGAQITGDETCMAGRLLYDPAVPDDLSTAGILRALAARYVSACTCPVFDQMEDRIYSIAEKLRVTRAEGIIYHVLRGCMPYDYEYHAVEQLADKLNMPILRVETDYSAEDMEQIRIRLEAFCEMLEERRRQHG